MAKQPNRKPAPQPAAATRPASKPVEKATVIKEEKSALTFSIKQLCLILAAVCFVLYINTLRNGYVLDDVMVLKDNTMVTQGTKAIPELMSTPHMRGYLIIPNDMYRPLSLVMFAIEYQFFGQSPAVSHFFNIAFFAGCVIMLFFFLDKLFGRNKLVISFIAAFVFAIHPIHTEVVANIKSRDELMCYFFAFWALNAFMNYMRDGKMLQLLLGAVLFFLSYLSKETVLTLLAIVPLIFFFYENRSKQRAIIITVATLVVTGIFIAIRASILEKYNANQPAPVDFIDNALARVPAEMSKFATEVVVMGKYLKLMFIPYPLLANYSYNAIPFVNFGSPWFWLSLIAYLGMIYVAITRFIKNRKDPWIFAIVFYLVTLSLFSNFPFLMGAELAERFAFFASTGFCIAVALAMEQWIIKEEVANVMVLRSNKVLMILVLLLLVFGGLTVARNTDWQSDYTLFRHDVEKSPDDTRLHHYLATAITETQYQQEKDSLRRKEMDVEAIGHLRESLRIYPQYSEANVELGRIYDRQQRFDSAEYYDAKALALNPENFTANNNLGSIYLTRGKYREAVPLFIKAMTINPNFKYAYFNLARTYVQLKRYDSAVYFFHRMLAYEPGYVDAYQEMASAFFMMQNFDSAAHYFTQVAAMKPNDANALNNLGAAYLNAKKYPQAIEQFQKAISVNPGYFNAYSNLGKAYYLTGQYQAAIDVINKELQVDPKNGRDVPYIALSYQKMGNMEMARKYEAIAKQIFSNFKLE